jgi:hypothetical protein
MTHIRALASNAVGMLVIFSGAPEREINVSSVNAMHIDGLSEPLETLQTMGMGAWANTKITSLIEDNQCTSDIRITTCV